MRSHNIILAICIFLALFTYIYITYQSWKQQQHLALVFENFQSISTFNTNNTNNSAIAEDNTNNDNADNNTANTILLVWSQMIQPNSSQSILLFNYQKQYYIRLMNNHNIIARGFDTLDELQNMMSTCCLPITKPNLDSLNNKILSKYKNSTPIIQKYLQYWSPKIQLAKSIHGLESNMPHTQSNVLMMPEYWWEKPDFSTFMHELVHVHQRLQPNEWNILYKKYWHFEYISGLDSGKVRGLDSIIARSRMNPDGTDFNWLWMGAKDGRPRWIGAVYPIGRKPKLTHVDYVSVPLDPVSNISNAGGYLLPTIYHNGQNLPLISDDREFMTFFGVKANNYHPNELGAQMMEEYIKQTPVNARTDIVGNIPAFTAFKLWLQNDIKWLA